MYLDLGDEEAGEASIPIYPIACCTRSVATLRLAIVNSAVAPGLRLSLSRRRGKEKEERGERRE
jgi:hypothetical protein